MNSSSIGLFFGLSLHLILYFVYVSNKGSSETGDAQAHLICLFDLILYVPSTIIQLNRDGVRQVLSWDKCVLLKDHNPVTSVRLEPAAPQA